MSKHTPGPWTVYEDAEEPTFTVQHEIAPSYYIPIWGKLFASNPPSDEDKANIQLIKAAPDMLEALEDIIADAEYLALVGDNHARRMKAKAAIAKAKGIGS